VNATDQRALGADLLAIIRRDRARRSRWKKFGEFLGKLLTALVAGFLTALINGWLFMLAIGVIHEHWVSALPTLGFWWSVLISWLLRSALSSTGSAKSERQSGGAQ
jgi:hypothetical protein